MTGCRQQEERGVWTGVGDDEGLAELQPRKTAH